MKHVHGWLLGTLLTLPVLACNPNGTDGFLPENNLNIPVGAKSSKGGLTEQQFNDVLTKVETLYTPIVKAAGGTLRVVRNWTDGTVNAYAEQHGTDWSVQMFGGLARHETITVDGMALVICHEIGHHLGGAPLYSYKAGWAATEGQADYFATMKCLRRVWQQDDNETIVNSMDVPKPLKAECGKSWAMNGDYYTCIRGGMAGLSVANLFKVLSSDAKDPQFDTPDTKVVTKTYEGHPHTQCRLDTYFQGALCEVPMTVDFSKTDETTGACHPKLGMKEGNRPLCWFKPTLQ